MIFENLPKITLDIIRYLSTFVKSCPLQDFDIIRYLYRHLTGFVGISNLSYWLSVHYKIVHRKIEPQRKEISPPTKSAIVMVPARCKLAYIRAGIIAIIGSAATGLISILSCIYIQDVWCSEDIPEDLPPHPKDCASAPREQNLNRLAILFTII